MCLEYDKRGALTRASLLFLKGERVMIFALIACGVIIVALLAVIIYLRNDQKFMTEMYHSLKSDHDRVLDKWKETIDKWDAALKCCKEVIELNKEVIELNKELRNDIYDFEQRISSLEKNYALYIIGDNDTQKICPSIGVPCIQCIPGGPCAVEEKDQ